MKQMIKRTLHTIHIGYLSLCRMLAPHWVVKHSKVLKLDLLLQPKQLVDFIIWKYGVFEPEVIAMLREVCPTGEPFLFVDIGSHLGQFSLFVAKEYPQAKVLAFEPNPEVYEQQAINQQLNGLNYSLFPFAVSDTSQTCEFYIADNKEKGIYGTSNNGMSSLFPQGFSINKRIEVDQVSGKDVIAPYVGGIDQPLVIKLDAQGAELNIISSLSKICNRQKRVSILIEFYWEEYKEESLKICRLLEGLGFALQPNNIFSNGRYGNYLFLKKS